MQDNFLQASHKSHRMLERYHSHSSDDRRWQQSGSCNVGAFKTNLRQIVFKIPDALSIVSVRKKGAMGWY